MTFKHSDDHTGSDIGLIAEGDSLEELFTDSAIGLMAIMVDVTGILENQKRTIELNCDDLPELYYDWLSELIYLKDAESFLFKRAEFEYLDKDKGTLRSVLFGDIIDPARHLLKTDVKAVTFYKFRIEQANKRWIGEVVFDL